MQDLTDHPPLEQWLAAHVPGYQGPCRAKKFAAGQSNPTYLLSAPSGRYVLRRKPPGPLLPSAHQVDREYRVMAALADTDVPVPRVYALCEDESVIGTMFFVMDCLGGKTIFDPRLADWSDESRRALYGRKIEVLAALATLDVDAIGLGDYGPKEDYLARQIARWTKQYRASETRTIEEMETLITWLGNNVPGDTGKVALVHGDFRLDNMRVQEEGARILGLIDWELSTLGDPLVDVSYFATMLRLPASNKVGGLGGVDRAPLGIPSESEMFERFTELSGLAPPTSWHFYLVFHCFRFTAILQGIAKRFEEGTASSESAREMGAMAQPIARMGCGILAGA